MKKLLLSVFLLAAFFDLAIGAGDYVLLDRTVAMMGNRVILQTEFDEYLCYRALKAGVDPKSLDRRKLLDDFIDEILVVEEAAKMGIVPSSGEKFEKKRREIESLVSDCPGECSRLCEDEGFPGRRALVEVALDEFREKRIRLFVAATPRDIERFYRERKDVYGPVLSDEVRDRVSRDLIEYLVNREYRRAVEKLRRGVRIIINGE